MGFGYQGLTFCYNGLCEFRWIHELLAFGRKAMSMCLVV